MVMPDVFFMKFARDGVVWNGTESDPSLKDNTGVVYPIPKDTRNVIEKVSFLYIVSCTEIDPFISLLSLSRSHEYNWTAGYMNHPFIPYRWEDSEAHCLDCSEENYAKIRWGESSNAFVGRNYAAVMVTWRVDVESVTFNAIIQLVLEHPLLSHLSMVNTGPPFPIPIEYPDNDGNGQWKFSEDVDVGLLPGRYDLVLGNVYYDVVDAFEDVGIS